MALSMKSSLVTVPVSQQARVQTRAPASVVVRASAEQSSRRAALSLIASTLTAGVALKASAVVIPSQESTGSTTNGGGALPRSTSAASMSSYTLEGTKKGGITPKRKAEVLAKLRAREGLSK